MADIFISYSKAYRALTEALAKDLEARGHTVWWDTSLLSGERFGEVIFREIDAAKVVIVIWSPASVKSEWVESEAKRARAQDKLITVRTSDVKDSDIPPPFDVRHCDLVDDREKIYAALAKFKVVATAEWPRAPVKKPAKTPWIWLGASVVLIAAASSVYYAKTLSDIQPQRSHEREEKLYVVAFNNKTAAVSSPPWNAKGIPASDYSGYAGRLVKSDGPFFEIEVTDVAFNERTAVLKDDCTGGVELKRLKSGDIVRMKPQNCTGTTATQAPSKKVFFGPQSTEATPPAPPVVNAPVQLVRTFAGTTGPVYGAAFSGDGRFAYSVGEHGIVTTFDVATGAVVRTFTPPLDFHFNGDARSAAFSRDGRYVLLGGAYSSDHHETKFRTGKGNTVPGGNYGRVLLIDLTQDQVVLLPSSLLENTNVKSVAISADGRFAAVATLSSQRSISPKMPEVDWSTKPVFSAPKKPAQKPLPGGVEVPPLSWLPDETLVPSERGWASELAILDIAYGQPPRTLEKSGPVKNDTGKYGLLAFSPDGRKIVASTADAIKIFDATPAKLATITIPLKKSFADCEVHSYSPRDIHDIPIIKNILTNSLSFSPDGKLVIGTFSVSCSEPQRSLSLLDRPIEIALQAIGLKLWDAATGKDIGDGERIGDITQAVFAPQGRYIAIGDAQGQASIFDTQTRLFARLDNGASASSSELRQITALAFSPDGRFLLSGSADKKLKLWDVSEWTKPAASAAK